MDLLELVQILLQLKETMPVGVVWCAHHGTLARATALVVPEVVVGDLEFIGPGVFSEQPFLLEFVEHGSGRLIIGLIIKLDRLVALLEEAVGVRRAVAVITHHFHLLTTGRTIPQERAQHVIRAAYVGLLGPQVPVQPFADVVGNGELTDTAHMASGASGAAIVTWLPGIRRGIHLPFVTLGIVEVAVLGVVEDLYIRVIRAQVTGGAGVRVSSLGNGELVTAVTGGATAGTTIWIDIAHAVVGPGFGGWAIVLVQLDLGAMALHTARFVRGAAVLWMLLPFMHVDQRM